MYWIYFRGTRNGEFVEAETIHAAKWIVALRHGLTSITYLAGKRVKEGYENC